MLVWDGFENLTQLVQHSPEKERGATVKNNINNNKGGGVD